MRVWIFLASEYDILDGQEREIDSLSDLVALQGENLGTEEDAELIISSEPHHCTNKAAEKLQKLAGDFDLYIMVYNGYIE